MTYLIQREGEIRVRRWDKRRWNDTNKEVRKTVLAYIRQQWDLVGFDDSRAYATATLEQHMTRADDDSPGWHHEKTLTIEIRTGKIIRVSNAKSFITNPRSKR